MEQCPFCGSARVAAGAASCPDCGAFVGSYRLAVGARLGQGRYTVGRCLGQGGFGVTYQGADLQQRRPVAIKELFPEGSARRGITLQPPVTMGTHGFTEARERFLDEARLLTQFQHPGIVRVFDVFEENGTAYLVMELLEGETLTHRVEKGGLLAADQVQDLAHKVGAALQEVHAAGLLHRDLKPDNLLLTRDDRVVLIDFGSARAFTQGRTIRHTRLITPGYAPLEQYATAARFGPFTDIYALGATLYFAQTGSPPAAPTDRMIGVPLAPLPGGTPPLLRTAVERALELRIEDRPQSVPDFLAMISTAQRPQPVPGRSSAPAQSAPTPTTTTPAATVVVDPGGNGHFSSLAEAVKMAVPGSVIHLKAGVHHLSDRLYLVKSVTLVGDGIDATFLEGDPAGPLLRCIYSGNYQISDLTIRRTDGGSGVVDCILGELTLTRCRLEGARAEGNLGGNGLSIWHKGKATVRESVFRDNDHAGMLVSDDAVALVEESTFTGNRSGGLRVIKQARCFAHRNTFEANAHTGISATDKSTVTLDGNVCRRNLEGGISLFDETQAELSRNVCTENEQHGIYVADRVRPTVTHNTCKSNGWSGIAFFGFAGGVTESNTCSGNGGSGVTVAGNAMATVRRNHCEGNKRSGVYVGQHAMPFIMENTCQRNVDCGIAFFDTARGQATANLCAENAHYGIYTADTASPNLLRNTYRENEWGDVN